MVWAHETLGINETLNKCIIWFDLKSSTSSYQKNRSQKWIKKRKWEWEIRRLFFSFHQVWKYLVKLFPQFNNQRNKNHSNVIKPLRNCAKNTIAEIKDNIFVVKQYLMNANSFCKYVINLCTNFKCFKQKNVFVIFILFHDLVS